MALLWAATARAHPPLLKRDSVRVARRAITIELDYGVADADGAALRERFDADRSLRLEPTERAALAAYLAAQAERFCEVWLDGRRLALTAAAAPALDEQAPAPSIRWSLAAAVSLAPGAHTIRLVDRHKDRRVTVPVAVAVDDIRLAAPLPPQPVVFADHPLTISIFAP